MSSVGGQQRCGSDAARAATARGRRPPLAAGPARKEKGDNAAHPHCWLTAKGGGPDRPLYHEPHSAGVVGHRRRTSLTQIVNQNSATTFEFVQPVINSGKGLDFNMKGQPNERFECVYFPVSYNYEIMPYKCRAAGAPTAATGARRAPRATDRRR
ncbi:hypothetical protein EVAR_8353_1 [Eumeta japonica]|uniref:Uncharacterized protein n=1 Tax=Eumeta variegata TaxID=151549 RepID=A0A4C1VDA8_EUMVA|nr:hypothetical protein EVAR_8353_1 [Eumeta japonica]